MTNDRNDVSWTGFGGKTLWDWMELCIIPAVLSLGLVWFNVAESQRARQAEDRRTDSQRVIEDQRAKEAALQLYLDRMTELLLEKQLRTSKRDAEVRNVARARTLTILSQIDGVRKGFLLRFLHESKLIEKENTVVQLGGSVYGKPDPDEVVLSQADLTGAKLNGVALGGASLTRLNLSRSDLRRSILKGSNLVATDLRAADLSNADVRETNLFNANLSGAILSGADLQGARLNRARLDGADLRGVKNLTQDQLSQACGDQQTKVAGNLHRPKPCP